MPPAVGPGDHHPSQYRSKGEFVSTMTIRTVAAVDLRSGWMIIVTGGGMIEDEK